MQAHLKKTKKTRNLQLVQLAYH